MEELHAHCTEGKETLAKEIRFYRKEEMMRSRGLGEINVSHSYHR